MIDALRSVLANDPRIAYALLFGSAARDSNHAPSDVNVAIGVVEPRAVDTLAVGELTSRLETAVQRPVHLVLLHEAPPGLAYRIFRDARPIVVRDRDALSARLARPVPDYLDFQPVEALFTRSVLRARHGR